MKDEAALADAIGRVMRLSDEEYQRMAEKSGRQRRKNSSMRPAMWRNCWFYTQT